MDTLAFAILIEEIARVCASTALTLAAGLKAWERGRRWLRRVRAALAD